MRERVAVDAFERGRGRKGRRLLNAEQARRLDKKERPQALAAAKRSVAHGLAQPLVLGRLAGLGEQPVEPSLDGGGHAFELCEKGHVGKTNDSGALPQNDW